MTERVRKAWLKSELERLREHTKLDLQIDHNIGGYRLELVINKGGGVTELGHRMNKSDFHSALRMCNDIFEKGELYKEKSDEDSDKITA